MAFKRKKDGTVPMQWTESIRKYRKGLLLFCSVYVYLGALSIYGAVSSPGTQSIDLSPLIPFENLFLELMVALTINTAVAVLSALIGGYALAPLYLLIHKTLYRKVIYGIQEKAPPETFRETFSGWYPTLLAFHINSIIIISNDEIFTSILGPEILAFPAYYQYVFSIITLMIFTLGIGLIIFSPVWFLLDAGIMYSTHKHVQGTRRPVEVRAVGGWFHDYLRGYAGFGVALAFILLLTELWEGEGLVNDLINLSWMFGLPLFSTLIVIPALIVLDKTGNHRIRYVRRIARRMGIADSDVTYRTS